MIKCLCVFINDILVSAFGFKVLLIEMWDEGDVLKQQQRDLTAEIWRFVGWGGGWDRWYEGFGEEKQGWVGKHF